MKRAIFIIACNYRGNPAVRELNVGRDMVGLGGFFEQIAEYDVVEIVQDYSREAVLAELDYVLSLLSPGDMLLIYFGGHGVQTTEQLLVLPPGPGDQGAPFGFLRVAELREVTDGRGLTRAMIFDSCRNEDASSSPVLGAATAFTRRIDTAGYRDVGVRSSVPRPSGAARGSFAIFSACSQGEVAPELNDRGKGLFSTALLNVLKQASKAGQRVRIDDHLRELVETEMHRLADAHGVPIKPLPYKEGNGTPEVLSGATANAAAAIPEPIIPTPVVSQPPAAPALPQAFVNSIGMRLVRIEPGTFLMGSPLSEPERDEDELQHKVTLTRAFYMATTAVSQQQWKAVMGQADNPSHFRGDDLPVEQVSWNDAVEFCERLSQMEDKRYRLPTEAEWEYCCRAGSTTAFNTGGTISTEQANYDGTKAYGRGRVGEYRQKTVPVGLFAPNAWGLYQTHGNVWEWCQDIYAPYGSGEATDPAGAQQEDANASRVLRGGSWVNYPYHCRSAYRYHYAPDSRSSNVGFRVVLDSP